MKTIWVYLEAGPSGTLSVGYELLGQAARMTGGACRVCAALPGGPDARARAAKAIARGADRVCILEALDPADPDEAACADALEALSAQYSPDALLIGATAFGRAVAPRLAAKLDTGLTADCTGLEWDAATGLLRQTRPAFGGNLFATILCPDRRPQMATVRPRVFAPLAPDLHRTGPVDVLPAPVAARALKVLSRTPLAPHADIGAARTLVAVGRGIGGATAIEQARRLAQRLGGALAASRPVVDAGLLPYYRQVGQTGKTVAPDLYIALGVSGSAQHMAGVAAGAIVAVNTDPDAPIFERADYALTLRCDQFLDAMLARLGPPEKPAVS